MPEICRTQRTDEWHAARSGVLTASLAAACLGRDPYTSAKAAWRAILGLGKPTPNGAMRWGMEKEPIARLDYEILTGNIVAETGFWIHPEHAWLGASPDGLLWADGLIEIKCPAKAPEAVPLHHRLQMLVQMEVTGRQWCDYYAWGADGSRLLVTVLRPRGLPALIARLGDWYLRHITHHTEPGRKRPRRRKT